jgi:hypothetical protein
MSASHPHPLKPRRHFASPRCGSFEQLAEPTGSLNPSTEPLSCAALWRRWPKANAWPGVTVYVPSGTAEPPLLSSLMSVQGPPGPLRRPSNVDCPRGNRPKRQLNWERWPQLKILQMRNALLPIHGNGGATCKSLTSLHLGVSPHRRAF